MKRISDQELEVEDTKEALYRQFAEKEKELDRHK